MRRAAVRRGSGCEFSSHYSSTTSFVAPYKPLLTAGRRVLAIHILDYSKTTFATFATLKTLETVATFTVFGNTRHRGSSERQTLQLVPEPSRTRRAVQLTPRLAVSVLTASAARTCSSLDAVNRKSASDSNNAAGDGLQDYTCCPSPELRILIRPATHRPVVQLRAATTSARLQFHAAALALPEDRRDAADNSEADDNAHDPTSCTGVRQRDTRLR